jgi:integrase/recombinase XerD
MPGKAKILTSQEIKDVFKLLDRARDRALFAIGLYTGLRISEILALEQDQLFTSDGGIRYKLTVRRLKKKNSVYSDIPLHPKLREVLKVYKEVLEPGPWLFPSARNCLRTLSRVQAHNVLCAAFSRLKYDGARTHSMRRTFLTSLSRAGVPLRTIQEMSGHSSLAQLQEYLDVDPEDKHKAIGLLRY